MNVLMELLSSRALQSWSHRAACPRRYFDRPPGVRFLKTARFADREHAPFRARSVLS